MKHRRHVAVSVFYGSYVNIYRLYRLEQGTILGAANRADISTIFAETDYKAAYLSVSYGTITKRLDDAKVMLFGQELKHRFKREGEEFEAGVLRGLGNLLDKMRKDIEADLEEQKKKLWSRVEKENGIVIEPDEEMGRWGLKIPHEELDEAMNKVKADKGAYKDVVGLFEAAEAESNFMQANRDGVTKFLLMGKDQA
jgi:hypothetical protein